MATGRARDGWGRDPASAAGKVNVALMAARGPVSVADVAALGHLAWPGEYLSRLARGGFVRRVAGGYEVTRAGQLLWRCAAPERGRTHLKKK